MRKETINGRDLIPIYELADYCYRNLIQKWDGENISSLISDLRKEGLRLNLFALGVYNIVTVPLLLGLSYMNLEKLIN